MEEKKVIELDSIVTQLKTKSQGEEMVLELKELLKETQHGLKGINEVEFVFKFIASSYNKETVFDMTFDIALARGLEYYTGSIIEVEAKDVGCSRAPCSSASYDHTRTQLQSECDSLFPQHERMI